MILPFENFTGVERLENMVSGMHSLLIGDIGRIGGLRVLGNTTSNKYKDVRLSIYQMGIESREIAGPHIYKNLNKALELDSDVADGHALSALIAFFIEWDWEKAEMEFLKAMDWLEKGFESCSQSMPYIVVKYYGFEPLFDNPRFVDILEKMNLPLPGG